MILTASSEEVERFRGTIARLFGLYFDDGKRSFLADVLNRLLAEGGATPETYLAQLEAARLPHDLDVLARELTVGETYFFRNIEQFHALREVVLPERMLRHSPGGRLRLLSAGCASGEEPYSMAIVARELLADASAGVSIRAVDINPASLDKAAHGRFSVWSLRETPDDLRQRWFGQEGRQFVLDDVIRRSVHFEKRNLADSCSDVWEADTYDVIFCRNVIMYLTPEHADAVIARITRSLAPGGYLFLGHAETLRGISQDFHLLHTHSTFYYQRRVGATQPTVLRRPEGIPTPEGVRRLTSLVEDADTWVQAILDASERIKGLTQGAHLDAGAQEPRPKWNLDIALELLRRERFVEALDIVHAYPPESERDPDVLLLRAVLLTHGGQLEQAEEVCRRLLAIDELKAGAHYVMAMCREGRGDRAGAVYFDQLAVYLDPSFAMPHFHLGLLARRSEDLDSARVELGQALVLFQREDASRLLLFGGGFSRAALIAMCMAELRNCGGAS